MRADEGGANSAWRRVAGELGLVRLALLGGDAGQRRLIEQGLGEAGVNVVLSGPPGRAFLLALAERAPDVLLVDMDPDSERCAEFVERLLAQFELPIVFNDVAALSLAPRRRQRWFGTLLEKVAGLAADGMPTRPAAGWPRSAGPAAEVWVLGASLGGPQALKRFLGALPEGLPVGFLVAQHLGANFVSLLAGQLDRASRLTVKMAEAGTGVGRGEALVVPVEQRLRLNAARRLELVDWGSDPGPYRPCIDQVIEEVARGYAPCAGTIIFSGMGQDGCRGSQQMAARGGTVWAQSAESCVISSMPDSVRALGLTSFSGPPEALAERLVERVSQKLRSGQ